MVQAPSAGPAAERGVRRTRLDTMRSDGDDMIPRSGRVFVLVTSLLACDNRQVAAHGAPLSAPSNERRSPAVSVPKPAGFETRHLVLYQPDAVLADRLSSVDELAAYTKKLQAACIIPFRDATVPEALDVVVAVKQGGTSRVWFVAPARTDTDSSLAELALEIERIAPPIVRNGPIAFAIVGSLAGAPREQQSGSEYRPPLPKAWLEAAQQSGYPAVLPDDALRYAWPTSTRYSQSYPETEELFMPTQRTTLESGLEVTVHSHDLAVAGTSLPAWTLVTSGLSAFGQREVVLTIIRRDASREAFPEGVLGYIPVLKHFASQGRIVDDGGVSGYRSPGPFRLGSFVGLAFMNAPNIPGIPLPDAALAGVFLTEGELAMASACSTRRVLNQLGKVARYFPSPYWSDPYRQPVYMVEDVGKSLLGRVDRATVRSAAATLRGNVMELSIPESFAVTLAARTEGRA